MVTARKRKTKTLRAGTKARYAKGGRNSLLREGPSGEVITFVDLFAGIGGFRLALEALGGRCVFSSEWDPHSQETYLANFGDLPAGDIHQVDAADIPSHDILTGGFPCQPFSIAGVSKKRSLGRPDGFDDVRQGNLFFEIARIIQARKPRAFILENVRNLERHDAGRTFRRITETLTTVLGYDLHTKVLDAQSFVPQHRERVFLVGFDKPRDFAFPEFRGPKTALRDILDDEVPAKYNLSVHLWRYLRQYAAKHKAAGNGFGYGLVGPDDIARTLSARYHKDGSEILVSRGKSRTPRRLTPRECARLMGFPESFQIVVSDTQAYRQFGNAVVVPVVRAIADRVVRCLRGERFENEIRQPRLFVEAS